MDNLLAHFRGIKRGGRDEHLQAAGRTKPKLEVTGFTLAPSSLFGQKAGFTYMSSKGKTY